MLTTLLPKIEEPLAAIDVARCIVKVAHHRIVDVPERGESLHEDIDPLKLQKLLYFAHAAHLAAHGTPLFDDPIEAWKLGPVVANVYDTFRKFGSSRIPCAEGKEGSPPVMEFLGEVWKTFGKYSAIELTHLSHEVGPWKKFYKRNCNVVIPNKAIEESFKEVFDFSQNESSQTQEVAS